MIKSQLVLNVAGQFRRIRQRAVAKAVDAIFDRMGSALAYGDRVELRGFGSFSVKVRQGHAGRNPQTGTKVKVPKRRHPAFRPSIALRKRLNPVAQTLEAHSG